MCAETRRRRLVLRHITPAQVATSTIAALLTLVGIAIVLPVIDSDSKPTSSPVYYDPGTRTAWQEHKTSSRSWITVNTSPIGGTSHRSADATSVSALELAMPTDVSKLERVFGRSRHVDGGSKTLPSWAAKELSRGSPDEYSVIQYGWPARALEHCRWRSLDGAVEIRSWLGLLKVRKEFPSPTMVSGVQVELGVPLRIVWRGFMIDAGLFLATVLGSWVFFRLLRSSWRLRRGLCERCGYVVGTTNRCPECGFKPI